MNTTLIVHDCVGNKVAEISPTSELYRLRWLIVEIIRPERSITGHYCRNVLLKICVCGACRLPEPMLGDRRYNDGGWIVETPVWDRIEVCAASAARPLRIVLHSSPGSRHHRTVNQEHFRICLNYYCTGVLIQYDKISFNL